MPEHATTTETGAQGGSAEAAQLREELNRSREEVLRLRDLLISKDAELGSFRGQVAALEAGTGRLLNVVTRVRSLFPGFAWRAMTALLRRLGRQG
jgi:hypothetical protein